MATNRIAHLIPVEVRPVLDAAAAGFDTDDNASIYDEVARIAQVRQLEARVAQLEQERTGINNAIIKTATDVAGALMVVAQFAKENKDSLKSVHFGRADGHFRFVLVGKSESFDWDLSDKTADLLSVLLKNYGQTPIGCQTLPSTAAPEDLGAILAQKICSLKPEAFLNAERK